MSNAFSKKLAEILGKVDDKVLETKINAAMDMLKKGNTEELAKKLNKMDKEELVKKINEFDMAKLQDLNIDKEEIKKRVSDADLNNFAKMLGDQGDEIIRKIKDILNN